MQTSSYRRNKFKLWDKNTASRSNPFQIFSKWYTWVEITLLLAGFSYWYHAQSLIFDNCNYWCAKLKIQNWIPGDICCSVSLPANKINFKAQHEMRRDMRVFIPTERPCQILPQVNLPSHQHRYLNTPYLRPPNIFPICHARNQLGLSVI